MDVAPTDSELVLLADVELPVVELTLIGRMEADPVADTLPEEVELSLELVLMGRIENDLRRRVTSFGLETWWKKREVKRELNKYSRRVSSL